MSIATNNYQPNSELLDRQPPSDFNTELAFCGLIISAPHLLESSGIYDIHFLDDRVRTVFNCVGQLNKSGVPIDLPQVVDALKNAGSYDDIGGGGFIADLMNAGSVAPSRFKQYADRLKERERRRRALTAALLIIKGVHSSQPTDDLLADAAGQFEVLASDTDDLIDYGGMTCRELFDTVDDTQYHIPGILAAGQPCVIAAPHKNLKTTVMLDMAISLSTATPLFGEIDVPEPVRIALMTGESGKDVIRRNQITIAAARGLDMRDIEGLITAPRLPQFGSPEHARAVRSFIRQHRLQSLIIDPAYLCMPSADAGNLFAQGALLRGMNDVCADESCGLLIVHHAKRNGPEEFGVPELSDIAWSGFAEWARQWILLRRREKYQVGSGIHRLWFNCGGSAGHQFLRAMDINEGTADDRCWQVTLSHADDARKAERSQAEEARDKIKAEKLQRDREKLVEAAGRYPAGETISVLRDAAGLSTPASKAALAAALSRCELEPVSVTKNNRTEQAYKVRNAG